MNGLSLLVRHEIKLAFRGGTDAVMAVVFFVLAASLFPFGVGPDPEILPRIGGGVIWVVALLASMLSLERMFSTDYEDGSLEQYVLSPLPMGLVALAKIIAHWLTTGILLLVAAPVLAVLYNMPGPTVWPLILSMLLGTPILSLIGSIGAALTLGARRSGVLISLLVLPLFIPVLIFGALVVDSALNGRDFGSLLMVLGGFLLLALATAPWVTAAALRQAIE